MLLLVICVLGLHNAANAQYFVSPEEPYYQQVPQFGAYPPARYGPKPFPAPQQPQQPMNPYSSLFGQPPPQETPQQQIIVLDSKMYAMYNIIKCLQTEGDLTKCSELIQKCDKLFNKKKKKKDEDDDADDADDDDDGDKKKKNKKKKKKSKDDEDDEDEDDDQK